MLHHPVAHERKMKKLTMSYMIHIRIVQEKMKLTNSRGLDLKHSNVVNLMKILFLENSID